MTLVRDAARRGQHPFIWDCDRLKSFDQAHETAIPIPTTSNSLLNRQSLDLSI